MLNRLAAFVNKTAVVTDEEEQETAEDQADHLRQVARRWASPLAAPSEARGTEAFTEAVTGLIEHEDVAKLRQQQAET